MLRVFFRYNFGLKVEEPRAWSFILPHEKFEDADISELETRIIQIIGERDVNIEDFEFFTVKTEESLLITKTVHYEIKKGP